MLHWWIFQLGLAWSLVENPKKNFKKLPLNFHSQTQICCITNMAQGRKLVFSAEVCRDSGQPQVIDSLHEWCVAYSRMSKSRICCRPGLNNSHFLYALPLHSKMWVSWSDANDTGVTLPSLRPRGVTVVSSASVWLYRSYKHWMGRNRSVQLVLDYGPTKHRGFETHLHVQPLLH